MWWCEDLYSEEFYFVEWFFYFNCRKKVKYNIVIVIDDLGFFLFYKYVIYKGF